MKTHFFLFVMLSTLITSGCGQTKSPNSDSIAESKTDEDFLYQNYATEFDALFKAIISRDAALEINTRRLGDMNKADVEKKFLPIYKRFVQLGGKYCTIGSDAHELHHLGRYVNTAIDIALAAGLQIVYYKERTRCL